MHRVALHGVGGDGNRRDIHVGAAQSASLGGRFLVAEAQHQCLRFELDAPDSYEECGPP
jgi:hypothetical protein